MNDNEIKQFKDVLNRMNINAEITLTELLLNYFEQARKENSARHKRKILETEINILKNEILLNGDGNVTEKRARGEIETNNLQEDANTMQATQHDAEILKDCYKIIIDTFYTKEELKQ